MSTEEEISALKRRIAQLERQSQGIRNANADKLRDRRVKSTQPTANQVLTWDDTNKAWGPAAGGGGGGAALIVQEDDVTVDGAAATLDFTEPDATLVTSSPATEANVNMALYALLLGRAAGQTLHGGNASSQKLRLKGNTVGGTQIVEILDSHLQLNSPLGITDSTPTLRIQVNTTTPHISLTGDVAANDAFRALEIVRFEGDVSPTWAAQQNNYDPGDTSSIYVTLTGNQTLTGIANGAKGRLISIHNIDTSDTLTIADEHVDSTSINRFALNANIALAPQTGALFQYHLGDTRWRCIGTYSTGGGAGTHVFLDGGTVHTDVAFGSPTKGNIIAGSGTAWDDIAPGANGTVLTADSAESLGVKWASVKIPRTYTWVIDTGADIVTGDAVGGHLTTNNLVLQETVTKIVISAGTVGTSITAVIQLGSTEDLDTATWSEIDSNAVTVGGSIITSSFTDSSIEASRLLRMNISAVTGSWRKLTVVMHTEMTLA